MGIRPNDVENLEKESKLCSIPTSPARCGAKVIIVWTVT